MSIDRKKAKAKLGRPRRQIPAKYNTRFVKERVESVAESMGGTSNLARVLRLSHSIIYCWFRDDERQLVPSPDTVLMLALLDAARLKNDPVASYRLWLENTGVEKTDQASSEEKIVESTDIFALRCKNALLDIIEEFKRESFSDFEARTALSAFIGQWSHEELLSIWHKENLGRGQVAFFWSWREGETNKRLKKEGPFLEKLKRYFKNILLSQQHTEGHVSPCQNRVSGFFLHCDRAAVDFLKQLKAQHFSGKEWERLTIYANCSTTPADVPAMGSLERWIDAWVFAGSTTTPFGVLVSDERSVLAKILSKQDRWAFRSNPIWASQILYLNRENLPGFLGERRVGFSLIDKVFEPDNTFWKPI